MASFSFLEFACADSKSGDGAFSWTDADNGAADDAEAAEAEEEAEAETAGGGSGGPRASAILRAVLRQTAAISRWKFRTPASARVVFDDRREGGGRELQFRFAKAVGQHFARDQIFLRDGQFLAAPCSPKSQ